MEEEQNISIARIEKKLDRILSHLNNDTRDIVEEVQTIKKHFSVLETMFYVLLGGMGIMIVLLLMR
jgi:hypothetical protein